MARATARATARARASSKATAGAAGGGDDQPTATQRREHIAVAVDVGPSYEHQLEYLVMLHGSWQHVVSEDDGSPENALIDMLVTCERCSRLPIECLPMQGDDGNLRPYHAQHRCLFAENND